MGWSLMMALHPCELLVLTSLYICDSVVYNYIIILAITLYKCYVHTYIIYYTYVQAFKCTVSRTHRSKDYN